jgi:hypothetical protein
LKNLQLQKTNIRTVRVSNAGLICYAKILEKNKKLRNNKKNACKTLAGL